VAAAAGGPAAGEAARARVGWGPTSAGGEVEVEAAVRLRSIPPPETTRQRPVCSLLVRSEHSKSHGEPKPRRQGVREPQRCCSQGFVLIVLIGAREGCTGHQLLRITIHTPERALCHFTCGQPSSPTVPFACTVVFDGCSMGASPHVTQSPSWTAGSAPPTCYERQETHEERAAAAASSRIASRHAGRPVGNVQRGQAGSACAGSALHWSTNWSSSKTTLALCEWW
jgi:hypothetical protein